MSLRMAVAAGAQNLGESDRLRQLLVQRLGAYRAVAAFDDAGVVCAAVPLTGTASSEEFLPLLQAFAEDATYVLRRRVACGVSGPAASAGELQPCFSEATAIVRRLLSRPDVAAAGEGSFAAGTGRRLLDRLESYDRLHGTAVTCTLRAYLACTGRIGEASTRLQVHENTVRYRLRCAEKVLGSTLDDPLVRAVLTMELVEPQVAAV